ncbi:MAG: hydrogenase maturation protease [Chloroflexota bacterium]
MRAINEVVVIGLGSPLMADEGIGVHLVRELEKRADEFPGVDFVDAGTSAMEALYFMLGRRKAILIDCAIMGEEPGTIRRFTPAEVRSRKDLPRLSLHEGDPLVIVELARKLGEAPPEIVIYGIEPARIAPGTELSTTLAARLARYQQSVSFELWS